MIDAACAELEPLISTKTACGLLGKSRATLYRHRNPAPPPAERPAGAIRPAHPAELGEAERVALLAVLNSARFVDRSPAQVWAILLDEGVYLASVSTMYRLLRAHDQTRERRAQATHPPRKTRTARRRAEPGVDLLCRGRRYADFAVGCRVMSSC